jgi:hypothetical protein
MPEVSQYISKDLPMSSRANIGDVVSNFFKVRKASLQSALHTYLLPFFNNSVIGFVILEKLRNEPSIIVSQSKETSHLVNRLWWLPIQDISQLARVHCDTFR